ncbi:reverse transcriptase domain-containing protein [Tanacetum coccineum]
MTTPVEKRNANKFCEFHGEVGHNTNECMHLRKQIEEMLKARKLSHLIKEIKQNNGKEQPKVTKKGETAGKDKAMAILMVQPWEMVPRQRITQSFSPNSEILFPPLGEDEGMEGPMIIEAEIGGHCVHHEEHPASALMNFVVVRSPSPYNGIIRRPGVRKLHAVPSTVYEMLNIPVEGGVESLCGFPFKCFLDAYKGYHQIQMAKEDEEKIAFITSQGIFCYTKMPFGLRNAGATYQRLVDKAFHKQIGRNLEVYVDDLVIKSRTEDEIVRDMEETFQTLREINMKLNPKKRCSKPSIPKVLKGCAKVKWKARKSESVFSQISREIITILQNFEKMHKEKRFPLDYGSGRSVQANEATHCQTSHASRTNGKGGAYCLSGDNERNVLALVHASKRLQRVSVKGQILADFIVERPEEESPDTLMEEEKELLEPWILFTDGSSCIDGSRAGLILTNPEGMEFTYALRFKFDATNNEAE